MPSRLSELRIVDPVLTELARGYQNEAFVGTELFPIVPVTKEAGKVPQFGKEAFKLYRTERGLGADPNRISPEGRDWIEFQTEEHAIEYPIDHREEEEDIFDHEQYATQLVMDVIQLRREKAIADTAQDLSIYPVTQKVTLSGTDQWTDYTNSDPIEVVKDMKSTLRKAIGREPNVLLLGPDTFSALRDHPKIIERIKYSQKGIVTTDLLAQIFDIERVVVGAGLYADEDGKFVDLWQDNAILAYVSRRGTRFDPSFAYTFRKKGQPVIYKYDAPNGLVRFVLGTDNFCIKVVGPDAACIINDTNA